MFCPSHQDLFYAVKHKFIQWGYSWCTLFSAPPTKKGRQQKKQFFLMEEFITMDEVISNK